MRGAFMSLNTAVQHLASGLAPLIAGLLITQTDDGKMTGFPVVGVVAAVAAVVSMALAGQMRPGPVSTAAVPVKAKKEAEEVVAVS
jgi:predicted MFS family arabinose efflux permease